MFFLLLQKHFANTTHQISKTLKSEAHISTTDYNTHLRSHANHTVEKCPHPSFLMMLYRLLNRSPNRTGWYPPEGKEINKDIQHQLAFLHSMGNLISLQNLRNSTQQRSPD